VGAAATRKVKVEEDLPSEKLEALVVFAMVALTSLAAIEVAHIAVLGSWNNEIFNAIVALIGTITGIIIGRKA